MERAHERFARRSPREASRPGCGQRRSRVLANTHRIGRFTSPPRSREGFERGSPKRPRSPRSANHCAERRSGPRPALPSSAVAWVLHDSRGNTFRFVVCRNSIQSAMALQLRVSNHQWQPYEERSLDRKISDLFLLIRPPRANWDGGESRARSGQCQPARRTTGRLSLPDVSNRAGGSIEVVW